MGNEGTAMHADDQVPVTLLLERVEAGGQEALGTTTRTIDRHWRFIVPWLHRELRPADPEPGPELES